MSDQEYYDAESDELDFFGEHEKRGDDTISSIPITFRGKQHKKRKAKKQPGAIKDQEALIASVHDALAKLSLKCPRDKIIESLMTFDSNKEKAVEALKNELAGEKLHAEQTKQKPQKKSVVITLEPQSPKPCQPKALNAQQPRASILDGDSESANELPDPRLSVPIPSVSTKPFSSRITRQHSYERRLELEKLLKERREKENLTRISLLVSGHVDAGKSTLLGHLLVLVGKVSNQTIQKYRKEAEQTGKGSFHYAWVMDEEDKERQKGITVDLGYAEFETEKLLVTVIDSPGHKDFVPNMIAGASQADAALLVINSRPNEFETGFADNGQTKEHALLLKSLGVTQLIVVINQLDKSNWSKKRYDEIIKTLSTYLQKVGFPPPVYVPTSAFSGENLTRRPTAEEFQWYKGKTLLEAINSLTPLQRKEDVPLRFSVHDVTPGWQMGTLVTGKVFSGIIGVGDRLYTSPNMGQITVKAMTTVSNKSIEVAGAGEVVNIYVTGDDTIASGSFLSDPINVIPVTNRFRAQILTFTLEYPITEGFQCLIYCNNTSDEAKITKLIRVINKESKEVEKNSPHMVTNWQRVEVEIQTQHKNCFESLEREKALSRFTLRLNGNTIAGGVIATLLMPCADTAHTPEHEA